MAGTRPSKGPEGVAPEDGRPDEAVTGVRPAAASVTIPPTGGDRPAGSAAPAPPERPSGPDAPQGSQPPQGSPPPQGSQPPGGRRPSAKAKRRGLNRLSRLRGVLVGLRREWCVRVWGMDIHPSVQMSLSAKLDLTFPKGVHVGEASYLAFESRILCHDRTRGLYLHTRVGRNCFVGGRSMILPGVEVGDGCVIGAGAVVTKSVPAGSVVAGNPARVLRSGIEVGPYGRFAEADATEAALAEAGLT